MKNKLSYILCLATILVPAVSSAAVTSSQNTPKVQSFVEKLKQYATPIAIVAAGIAGTVVGLAAHIFYTNKSRKRLPFTKEQYADCFKKIIHAAKTDDTDAADQKIKDWQTDNNVASYETIALWEVLQNNKAQFQPALEKPAFKAIKDALEQNDRNAFIAQEKVKMGTEWYSPTVLDTFSKDTTESFKRASQIRYANLKKYIEITKGSSASLPDYQTVLALGDMCLDGLFCMDRYTHLTKVDDNLIENSTEIFGTIATRLDGLPGRIKSLTEKTNDSSFNNALDATFDGFYTAAQESKR